MEGIDSHRTSAYGSQVRLLLGAAMVIFVFTVVVGILNGTDIIEFDRKTILTHVHTGTLGWITTAVFAAALSLFSTYRLQRCRRSVRILRRALASAPDEAKEEVDVVTRE